MTLELLYYENVVAFSEFLLVGSDEPWNYIKECLFKAIQLLVLCIQ